MMELFELEFILCGWLQQELGYGELFSHILVSKKPRLLSGHPFEQEQPLAGCRSFCVLTYYRSKLNYKLAGRR